VRVARRDRAERLARVMISDLVAEWGEEIRIGLEKDDLFTRLASQIEGSRRFFLAHVEVGIEDRERIFDWALVDGLLLRNRAVRSYIL